MTDQSNTTTHETLKAQVANLERQLAELTASLSSRSPSRAILVQLENLEKELEQARQELAELSARLSPPQGE